jgi:hypothetical protein
VASLPEAVRRGGCDFDRSFRTKREEDSFNGLLPSESAPAKDCNTPEEEAARANLERIEENRTKLLTLFSRRAPDVSGVGAEPNEREPMISGEPPPARERGWRQTLLD